MLCRMAVLSVAEQLPRLLSVQEMFQMQASLLQHPRGWMPASDASLPAPVNNIHVFMPTYQYTRQLYRTACVSWHSKFKKSMILLEQRAKFYWLHAFVGGNQGCTEQWVFTTRPNTNNLSNYSAKYETEYE